ncbi:MAG TPA: bifunctional sugar-1-phosphate nucleotidylyltransferase/acetyltransferase [Candidatus Acidoferrum sp.]|nr:bifunctional sugar-1-phosphate nucleotidylyltransferase/acetyltransferase [Candidatus Acidoferrum sp.]
MLAVVLAAGEGTRMRPLTHKVPKVMLPVEGKPVLEHIIKACLEAEIKQFIIVTGYHEEIIKSYFGDGHHYNAQIRYVSQNQPLGTAHAIAQARDFIEQKFLVLNGDSLVSSSTVKALAHKLMDKTIVVAIKEVAKPQYYGVIEVRGDEVVRIIEKPKEPLSNLANLGIYGFDPVIFNAIDVTVLSSRGEYEITDSIQFLIDQSYDVGYLNVRNMWIDIGTPWDLLSANEILLKGISTEIDGAVEPFATIVGDVKIGEGSIIRNGSYIVGPVIIGEYCDIGPNCYLRPSTAIGHRVKVGNAVEVKNSIIMDDTKIGHLSYVGDSVIGHRCNFGAGTLIANLRFDEKNIKVGSVDTGRRKLGVVMGDDVHTGINSMINVGTMIGPDSKLGMGALADGIYPLKSRIR